MAELTPKQARFVDEYLVTLNGTQAAIKAGYAEAGANVTASKLLANPNLRAIIDQRKLERSAETKIDAAWVLKRLAAEAEADINDIYDENGALRPVKEWPLIFRQGLVAGIETDELEVGGVKMGLVRKIKQSDRIRRLELIGKHVAVNAFQETVAVKGLDELADRLSRARSRNDG